MARPIQRLRQIKFLFVPFAVSLLALISLTACTSSRPPNDVFEIRSMSDSQWQRVQLECDDEASKAVAAQKPGPVRHYDWRAIFLKCLELKGAKFIGTADQLTSTRQ